MSRELPRLNVPKDQGMRGTWAFVLTCLGVWLLGAPSAGTSAEQLSDESQAVKVFADYASAYFEARKHQTRLLILFRRGGPEAGSHLAQDTTDQPFRLVPQATIADKLNVLGIPSEPRPVVALLPLEAEVRSGGQVVRLLDHSAFSPLKGGQGYAIVDFTEGKEGVISDSRSRTRHASAFDELVHRVSAMAPATPRAPPSESVGGVGFPEAGCADLSVCSLPRFRSYVPPVRNFRPMELPIRWWDSYQAAYEKAAEEERPLLIYFRPEGTSAACEQFDTILNQSRVAEFLRYYVCVKVGFDSAVLVDGREVKLLAQPAFYEMLGQPGLAIVDLAHKEQPYYASVVSTFPFLKGRPYTVDQTLIILTLPPGTLTQRTLIYAVRSHPERPLSADGVFHPLLAAEATSHAAYQARIGVQGHHFWDMRFRRILSRLPLGLVPQEVCAESWPGQNLLESAIECVRCWRLSSGHWSAVARYHPYFGYDMKRGPNGVWYATGIFAKRDVMR